MTIRFTCAGCGSLLKIKDELAGTDGKCPKCKTEFVVPEPESDEDSAELLVAPSEPAPKPARHSEKPGEKSGGRTAEEPPAESAEKRPSKPTAKPAAKPASKQTKKNDKDEEFDPAAFLMDEGAGPRRSPSAIEEDDDSDPEPPPARSSAADNRQKRPAAKAPTPGGRAVEPDAGSGIGASSHAKEMMMKAMEESRAHASDMPQEPERRKFDFAGMFREVGLKIGGGLLFGVVLTYGLYLMFDGMMSSRLTLPPLGYVAGTVTLDGSPLPGATVYFAPVDAKIGDSRRERARTSYGITDEHGHYKMIYINQTQGVAAGKCRVWLDLLGPKGQVIPAEFSEANLTIREVKPGSQPPFDFELKSK